MSAYLDHAASTPLRPEAFEAMLPWLQSNYANPSGAHRLARHALRAIDEARDVVAACLGAEPGEIIFTSGGTESDNLAILGVHDAVGGTVLCAATEHHAVLEPVESRAGRLVPVGPDGRIKLEALEAYLDPDVTLVSVMASNNEVGTVQPLAAVAEAVGRLAPQALLHTDAVQAISWLDVAGDAAKANLISVSAHKFGGPKGVGALVVRSGTPLQARHIGGGQERERRSGTQNVAGIVALAQAMQITVDERQSTVERIRILRDRLADGLRDAIPDLYETGVLTDSSLGQLTSDSSGTGPSAPDRSALVAGICHVCIQGIESEALLFLLEQDEVYASAAASCASGAMEPSHVLAAMGLPRELANGALRLSLGWCTTEAEVEHAITAITRAVERLRQFRPPTLASSGLVMGDSGRVR